MTVKSPRTPCSWIRDRSSFDFETIVNAMPNGILVVDSNGNIVLGNTEAVHLFGYKNSEFTTMKIEELVPKRFRSKHPDYRHAYFTNPKRRAFGPERDLYGLRKDGREFAVELALNPIDTPDGVFVLASVVDVSDRKAAEERFRAVVESAPNALVIITEAGVITLVNKQMEITFGYNRKELIGKSIEVLIPERYRKKHPGYREKYLKKPNTRPMGAGRDLFGLHKNGTEIPVEIGLKPVEIHQELHVLASIVNITERKKVESELQKSEIKFRQVIESAPNGIIMIDQEGKVALCNRGIENLFGYDRDELIGTLVESLIPYRFRNKHAGYRKKYLSSPEARQMGTGRDLFGLHKGGYEFPVEIGLNPLETDEGTFVLASVVDISKRRDLDEKIRIAAEELQVKNQELEQFVYSVSHDLRSPLVSIRAFTQRLLKDEAIQAKDQWLDYLGRIDRNVKMMDQLLNDLLNLSRVSQREIVLEPVNLCQTIQKAADTLRASLAQENSNPDIPFTIQVQPFRHIVKGQENLLAQVFTNLFSNSIKYARPGVAAHIEVSARVKNHFFEVSVKDNGRGIPADQREKVFKIFERFHIDVKEGNGVGLAIVKKIIERHGGSIRYESEENNGTIFTITLP